jgi:succinate dehydrogenase/fumarate reductase flavoprotein subunit
LATGGAVGELYPRSSNNPLGVTTDAAASGHAMAWRAGAELLDMEMIQFVPLPADPDCENLRYTPEFWKGPYHDADGNVIEDDVARYDGGTYAYPFVRLLFDHATRHGPVYIDQRDRPPPAASKLRIWQARRRRIQQLGIDPAGRRIEITVGSHFAMGGVRVAPTTATTLPGLFAAGEIMGGVHGAHRLSGFSFSQMISFGYEAGARAAEHARGTASPVPLDGGTVADEAARLHALSADKPRAVALRTLKSELRRIMHDHLFLVRNAAGLRCAIERLAVLRERLPRLAVPPATAYNLDRMRAIEFGYTLDAAELITRSALARQESRGHHFRDDYPAEDDTRLPQHTVARRVDGQPRIDLEPVVLSRLQPEVRQWKAS